MTDFWKEAEVLGTEFTMVSQKRSARRSAGPAGEVQRLRCGCVTRRQISQLQQQFKEDRAGYAAQAGGYLWLMDEGDGAKDERPPYVEKCRTLIVTPKKVDWLTAMDPTDCAMQWEEAWGAYSAASLVF